MHRLKLSEIKLKINNVLINLDQLECMVNGPDATFDGAKALYLQERTTALLEQLEQLPFKQVARVQHRRKCKRLKNKQNVKAAHKESQRAASSSSLLPTENVKSSHMESGLRSAPKSKEHIRLTKHHDATKILHTLDLLERLYEVRGGDKAALKSKLARLRGAWTHVRVETETESKKDLEIQWKEVLFGNDNYTDKRKENVHKFVQRRFVWDSYITPGGSCVPAGWVLPPAEASPEWAQFKCVS